MMEKATRSDLLSIIFRKALYRISLGFEKLPKNGRRTLLRSPKYPEKVMNEEWEFCVEEGVQGALPPAL